MAISTHWLPSPVTRPAHSPSIVARPSSSRPSSAKNEMAASRDSTTMPTLSIRWTVTRPTLVLVAAWTPHRGLADAQHFVGCEELVPAALDVAELATVEVVGQMLDVNLDPRAVGREQVDGQAPHFPDQPGPSALGNQPGVVHELLGLAGLAIRIAHRQQQSL